VQVRVGHRIALPHQLDGLCLDQSVQPRLAGGMRLRDRYVASCRA
jgi:hypothetical protein